MPGKREVEERHDRLAAVVLADTFQQVRVRLSSMHCCEGARVVEPPLDALTSA